MIELCRIHAMARIPVYTLRGYPSVMDPASNIFAGRSFQECCAIAFMIWKASSRRGDMKLLVLPAGGNLHCESQASDGI